MDNWDEIRTAYQVARLGTVSAAAETLDVHHATVIRHIDALEKRLGVRLFQRHARGYTPTEAGHDLLAVAQATEEQFAHLISRIKGQGESVEGELALTTVPGLAPLFTPVLVAFQKAHPALRLRYLSDTRLFRLEYGEAHVAIRAGAAPKEPDNVVQPLAQMRSALYASRRYAEEMGLPKGPKDFPRHRFIGHDEAQDRAPFFRWLRSEVPPETIVYRATEAAALEAAILAGAGIGFLPVYSAQKDPQLVEVMPPRPEWTAALWIVTHVDLHRTAKVQQFVAALKSAAAGWKGL